MVLHDQDANATSSWLARCGGLRVAQRRYPLPSTVTAHLPSLVAVITHVQL
jgi:hypothetical protein